MIKKIPPAVMYGVFATGAVIATSPIWQMWLYGFNPTLDELLQLRCFPF